MPTPASLARLAPAVLAGALALGAGACADAVTPVPPMTSPPSTTTGAMGDGGGSGMPGGMMGDRTATPATSHTGPVAGEDLDPTAAASLQAAVDQGSQPWRLDPQMTAVAFARARFGWMMARPLRTAPDTVVLDGGRGGEVSVHVVRPARTGTGGIWTITGGTWMR
jgi:hypothetical protein